MREEQTAGEEGASDSGSRRAVRRRGELLVRREEHGLTEMAHSSVGEGRQRGPGEWGPGVRERGRGGGADRWGRGVSEREISRWAAEGRWAENGGGVWPG